MRNIFEIEGALGHLPVSFRRWELEDGILYFCEGPSQTTFNLWSEGALRIWQFLPMELPGSGGELRIERAFGLAALAWRSPRKISSTCTWTGI